MLSILLYRDESLLRPILDRVDLAIWDNRGPAENREREGGNASTERDSLQPRSRA
jgi:hypothetical protein